MFNECRHVMPSGLRCHAAALRQKSYCYFHARLRQASRAVAQTEDQSIEIAPPEDAHGIQIALAQVLRALGTSRIDPRRAGLILYGLQIAAQLTRSSDQVPVETVRSVTCEEDGEELAPEKPVCEPGIDCANCRNQDDCRNYDEPDEDEYEQYAPCEEDEEEDTEDDDDEDEEEDDEEEDEEDEEDEEEDEDEDDDEGEDEDEDQESEDDDFS